MIRLANRNDRFFVFHFSCTKTFSPHASRLGSKSEQHHLAQQESWRTEAEWPPSMEHTFHLLRVWEQRADRNGTLMLEK